MSSLAPVASESPRDIQPVQLHRRASTAAPTGPWSVDAIQALLDKPLMDLLFEAQTVHRQHWPAGDIELATLLSVKTGGCPENCGYCPQSSHFDTGVQAQKLMAVDEVRSAAQAAKNAGATRFCMGAAWRAPKERDIEKMSELIRTVKDLGLQTCATLGMLQPQQAQRVEEKDAKKKERQLALRERIAALRELRADDALAAEDAAYEAAERELEEYQQELAVLFRKAAELRSTQSMAARDRA